MVSNTMADGNFGIILFSDQQNQSLHIFFHLLESRGNTILDFFPFAFEENWNTNIIFAIIPHSPLTSNSLFDDFCF